MPAVRLHYIKNHDLRDFPRFYRLSRENKPNPAALQSEKQGAEAAHPLKIQDFICLNVSTRKNLNCPIRISYTLRRGDTFYKIAQRYRTTVEILQMENPHMNPMRLMPGDVITICPGVTAAPRHERPREETRETVPAPVMPIPAPMPVMPEPMPMPVPEPVMPIRPEPRFAPVIPEPMPVPVPMPAPVTPVISAMPPPVVHPPVITEQASLSDEVINLHDVMRSLWGQQALWMHQLLTGIAEGRNDTSAVNNRLVRGNENIAALFAPLYNPETAQKIGELLNHVLVYSVRLAQKMKAGGGFGEESGELRKAAGALTEYLCGLGNRAMDCRMLNELFGQYIDSFEMIAKSRLNMRYPDDIAAADEAVITAMEIADILSGGLM